MSRAGRIGDERLGGAGEFEKRFHRRREKAAGVAADFIGGAGEVEEGDQLRGVGAAALTAEGFRRGGGDEPRAFAPNCVAAASGALPIQLSPGDHQRAFDHFGTPSLTSHRVSTANLFLTSAGDERNPVPFLPRFGQSLAERAAQTSDTQRAS